MNYTGIAEVGCRLADILREHMVPEVVKKDDLIGLCSSADKTDFRVGIWLYDIRECEELRSHAMRSIDRVRQRFPSSYVNLFYRITAFSNGDVRYRAKEEQYMLGKVIQTLKDHAVMEMPENMDGNETPSCTVTLLNLSMEDKMRMFSTPNVSYKASLFYEVGPVEIESEKVKQVTRVTDLTFDFRKRETGNGR